VQDELQFFMHIHHVTVC